MEDLQQRCGILHIGAGAGIVCVDIGKLGERIDLLQIPVPPVPQMGSDTPKLGEGGGHPDHPLRAGHIHSRVAHVGDEEYIISHHLLKHGKQTLVVQHKVLKFRVKLHVKDAEEELDKED